MDMREAYAKIGADYDDVLRRLVSEGLVKRFASKFAGDPSFASLQVALNAGDVETAFRAAHTLKGVCQNLGLCNLFAPTSELTEVLRAGSLEGTDALFENVKAEYDKTVAALAEVR